MKDYIVEGISDMREIFNDFTVAIFLDKRYDYKDVFESTHIYDLGDNSSALKLKVGPFSLCYFQQDGDLCKIQLNKNKKYVMYSQITPVNDGFESKFYVNTKVEADTEEDVETILIEKLCIVKDNLAEFMEYFK